MNSDSGMYFVKGAGWDLFKAMSDLLDVLEAKVKRQREKELDKRKGR
jgi:hypothetical protein